jgi:small subunit ribosomal protein S8
MDPISDMLIQIKNAQAAGHATVRIPYSRLKHEIAKVLERAGFAAGLERRGKRIKKTLEISFSGPKDAPAIYGIKGINLFSTPGRRLYCSYRELRRAPHGGIYILTTSKGVFSGAEAKKEKAGGEIIAEVW